MICAVHHVPMKVAKTDHGIPTRRCPRCIADAKARCVAVRKLWRLHSRRHFDMMQHVLAPIPAWERT